MNLVLAAVKELMEDNINEGITPGDPDRIKTFYQGEVILVPKPYLPALMVFGRSSRTQAHGTAKDQVVYSITIRVVVSALGEFTEDGTGDIIKAPETLADLVEEADETTGVRSATSVIGILRRNIRVQNRFLFNNDITANYNMLQKGKFFYAMADVNFTATTDLVLRS